jgi:hypothetical protein
MTYIITANPAQLPIVSGRPLTQPVTSVTGIDSEFRDASKRQPSTHVYRGELLSAVANDKRYRPQLNQQIDPANRHAIESYQQVVSEPSLQGQILDGFI